MGFLFNYIQYFTLGRQCNGFYTDLIVFFVRKKRRKRIEFYIFNKEYVHCLLLCEITVIEVDWAKSSTLISLFSMSRICDSKLHINVASRYL